MADITTPKTSAPCAGAETSAAVDLSLVEKPLTPDTSSANIQRVLQALVHIDKYIDEHYRGNRTLWEGQIEVFESLRAFLRGGETCGYVHLTTRCGKTVIFVEFIEALGLQALVVVPTKDLIHQTADRMAQFAPRLRVGKYFGEEKCAFTEDVIITTYASFLKGTKAGTIRPGQFPLMILDEAQESMGVRTKLALSRFKGHSIILGFSGSPEYDAKRSLVRLLGPEIHFMSVHEAVELEMICPFRVMLAQTDIDISSVDTALGGDYNRGQLARALNIASLNKGVVDLYLDEFAGQGAIVSCATGQHAMDVLECFRARGVKADTILHTHSRDHRRTVLQQLQSGELDVLTQVRLLNRGVDLPRVSVQFNLTPTLSKVVATQRGGRPLTRDPKKPGKIATIVEFIHGRGQVTYFDVANDAFVAPRGKRAKLLEEQEAARRTLPPIHIEGLQVTTRAEKVAEILVQYARERQTAIAGSDECDRLGREYRYLKNAAEEPVLQFPAAVRLLRRKALHDSSRQRDDMKASVRRARERLEASFQRMQIGSISSRGIRASMTLSGGLVEHLGRRYEALKLTKEDFESLRLEAARQYRRLEAIVEPIDQIAKLHNMKLWDLLGASDERIRVSDEERANGRYIRARLGASELLSIDTVRRGELAAWEEGNLLRWDVFIRLNTQLGGHDEALSLMESQLFRSAVPVVKAVAREYHGRMLSPGELVQEGMLAVEAALARFRTQPGYKFSPLVVKYARRAIEQAIETEAVTRGELGLLPIFVKAKALIEDSRLNGVPLGKTQLAEALGVRQKRAAQIRGLLACSPAGCLFASDVERQQKRELFRQQELDDAEPAWRFDEYAPDPSSSPDERYREERIEVMKQGLAALNVREQLVLELRFAENLTLAQIGERVGLSNQSVRNVIAKASRKLHWYMWEQMDWDDSAIRRNLPRINAAAR